MSTLNVEGIKNTAATSNAITLAADGTCTANVTNGLSNRRLNHNGAMLVSQRGTSTAWAANGYLTCDGWNHNINSSAGRWTAKQTADGPDGFSKCLELDVTTADTSIAAAEHALIQYKWEGQDVQCLGKGTPGAKKFTVSFYVKGNGNATYYCEFYDRTNDRVIRQQFAVTASWTRVILTFNNETSNAITADNSHELDMMIWLHAGSDFSSGTYTANTWSDKVNANRYVGGSSIFSSTNNYFRITGVQVEVGSVATDFEHKSYGEELTRCQRYLRVYGGHAAYQRIGIGYFSNSSRLECPLHLAPQMRTTPTMTYSSAGHWKAESPSGSGEFTAVGIDGNSSNQVAIVWGDKASSFTAGESGRFLADNTTDARIYLSSEM